MATQKFPHLFSPIKIANHIYKNRILCAPQLFGFYALEKESAERVYKIVEDRAKGGVAEVVVGETPVNYDDACDAMVPWVNTDYTKPRGPAFEAYKKYVDIIKRYDSIALIEIFHSGINRAPKNGFHPWGPVAIVRPDGIRIEPFNTEKMKKVRDDFVTCAEYMKAAGYDGILIHGAHGYLFTQFLSPLINRRTDEYGGSIENRGRFPREIIADIRKNLGKNFIIELRINGADIVEGGATNEDIAAFCSTLEGLVDIIHVSVGMHADSYNTHTFSSQYDPYGINVERAANIKKRTKIPVTVVGGINSPEFAERIIAEGKVDFVSLGRQSIADPDFANKAREGRESEIRRCLRCYNCYGAHRGPGQKERTAAPPMFSISSLSTLLDGVGHCTVNPRANNEVIIDKMPKPEGSRKVLVVGGGPGGMQAAITAADRRQRVTLAEKGSSLGGILYFADMDVHKVDLKNFKDLLVREVGRRKIKVLLNTEVNPEFIKKFKPDALILAIGASACTPDIPGLETAMPVLDIYKKDAKIGKNVVIVGGGLAGCESALYLVDTGHNITIVEMLSTLASEIAGMPYDALVDQIKRRKNIAVKTGVKCIEISPHGVKVEGSSGNIEVIEGDTIVYSLGMKAKRADVEKLRAAAVKATIFEVGDCVRGAKVFEATNEGFMAAMKIT
jgi:2,4-dienoyl-CoA reductase-like NADH-dependent reductase (Old Yellow Enzyme family)/thioredoxin reductase